MKLVTFEAHGQRRIGALVDGARIADLTGVAGLADMNALIARYEAVRGQLADALADPARSVALADAKLLAPIPEVPRNVFCVGKNYFEHAHEFAGSGFDSSASRGAVPPAPIIFSKPPSSVCGPGDAIDTALDPLDSVDYEAELAIVIGKRGRVTDGDDPWSFVFGYTLVNDVTSRGLQKHHSQWLLGKGIDGFCPMGPAILTRDEVPDLGALQITCRVNGELRQSAALRDLIFDVPTLVRTIGRSITLLPGDVIATGTPAGVGLGFDPPRYLKPGDRVSVEIAEIGALDNPVV